MTLSGHPGPLLTAALEHRSSSATISEAADVLRMVTHDGSAASLAAIRTRTLEAAADLGIVHECSAVASGALVDYAVRLGQAQRRADAAQQEIVAADGRHDGSAAALAEIASAQREIEDAAEETIARLAAATPGVSDASHAGLAALAHEVVTWLDETWRAYVEMLDAAVTDLRALADTVVAVASTALILLVVHAVLGVILTPLLGPLGPALAATSLILAAGYVITSVLSDVARPTPSVARFRPGRAAMPAVTSAADLLAETVEVDRLGGGNGDAEHTVIKVTEVVGSGETRWRVVLPSTQEWLTRVVDTDAGATNDLDANLTLMLAPALATQYERGVLAALEAAGVGPDDPVMLVGFSQGGIMAGHLAAYHRDYHWDTIVVSGAPIDNMPIPDSVDVVSIQHERDPVPRLDTGIGGIGLARQAEHWLTIHSAAPGAGHDVGDIHNADAYAITFAHEVDLVRDRFPGIDEYFPAAGEATRSEYFRWSE